MIDPRTKAELMQRLCGLSYPPTTKAAMEDLGAALSSAKSDAAATAAVNNWVDSYAECPKPAQMRAFISSENDRIEQPEEHPRQIHCRVCRDTGIKESLNADSLRSVASFCNCHAGAQREERSCRDGHCREMRPTKPLDEPMRECCCPPWRVNEARAKIRKNMEKPNIRRLAEVVSDVWPDGRD